MQIIRYAWHLGEGAPVRARKVAKLCHGVTNTLGDLVEAS